jgi:hypothetical protein
LQSSLPLWVTGGPYIAEISATEAGVLSASMTALLSLGLLYGTPKKKSGLLLAILDLMEPFITPHKNNCLLVQRLSRMSLKITAYSFEFANY